MSHIKFSWNNPFAQSVFVGLSGPVDLAKFNNLTMPSYYLFYLCFPSPQRRHLNFLIRLHAMYTIA